MFQLSLKKYSKHISWVIGGTSSSKLSCNPRHPSRNISCNHRHHLLQPSWRRIFSTSNKQKTTVDRDINSDYKASSFDKLYIRHRKWDTAGFVRAHRRKYWNALTVGRGHADDGCSCNHRAVPPSVVITSLLRLSFWRYDDIITSDVCCVRPPKHLFSGHMVHVLPLKLSTNINFASYLQGKWNESGHRKCSSGQHGVPHGTKPYNHGYS